MRWKLAFAFSCLLAASCGGDETTAPQEAPAGPAFSDIKGDSASSCSGADVLITDEEIASHSMAASCGTTWFERGARFTQTVDFEVAVSNPSDVRTKFVGVCVQRLEYTRFYGLNLEHPFLAGWQEDTVDTDYTPCGWYEIRDGALFSVDDGLEINTFLEPGWYNIGLSVPDDFTGEDEVEFDIFAAVLEGERTCGNGVVDSNKEFCDDGNDTPMDACGLDCFWNESFVSEVDDNELPEEAVSLEGFQIVNIDNIFRGEDDADWFAYTAPTAGDMVVKTSRAQDILLTLYHVDEPDVAVDSVELAVCTERCTLTVPEAGEYFLEFWRMEPGGSYQARIEGPNINL